MGNVSDDQPNDNNDVERPAIPPGPVIVAEARAMGLDQIPALAPLLALPRWCAWGVRWSRGRKGGGAWVKKPLIPAPPPAEGVEEDAAPLRTNHPDEAGTYAAARAMVARGAADGVGWVMTGELEWCVLDFDRCRDPVTGKMAPWAEGALAELEIMGAYTEVSPSGGGVRVIGRARFDGPVQGKVKIPELLAGLSDDELAAWGGSRDCHPRAAIEIFYACVRFVTVTGWFAAGGVGVEITDVALGLYELGEAQLPEHARERVRKGDGQTSREWTAPIDDVVSALRAIPNGDEGWDEWSRIGMAVWGATGGSDEGLLAWSFVWSAKSVKHDEDACAERWEYWSVSSPPTRSGFGTLAKAAKDADPDWRRPSRAPEAEFEREEDPGDARPEEEAAPFKVLLERVSYIPGMRGRWFDRGTLVVMHEVDVLDLAGQLGVKGHSETGKKGITARLRGHRRPPMKRLIGLGCMPGRGPVAEAATGKRGLRGNLWSPSLLEPNDGDPSRFLDQAARLIRNEDDLARVLDWMAFILQRPGVKVNHAIVLVGGQMTGKDTFLKPFIAAIGQHNASVIAGSQLGGAFNNEMTKQLLQINEMPHAHKRDLYEDMKPLLAAPPDMLRINEKNIPAFWIPNIINVIVTTNHLGAIALADDDRRFDIIQTHHSFEGTEDEVAVFYTAHHRWLDEGGCGAVMGWLLRRDVSAFEPRRAPPRTQAKIDMTRAGAHPASGWVVDLLGPGGPLARRELVSVGEILGMAQAGRWGTEALVANRISPELVARGLVLAGWRRVARSYIEGERHRVWARSASPELLAKLPPQAWLERLEKDRKQAGGGSEF